MNVYIMDPQTLDRLAILNTYTAFSWVRTWGESGAFKIWAPLTAENEEFLVRENLVWPDSQHHVGVIESVHKYTSEDTGLALIEVSGRFIAASYLSRRIIWENALITDNPANVIHKLVRSNAIACQDYDRRLGPAIQTSMILDGTLPSQRITYCNSYGNLWEQVRGLDLEYGLDVEFQYGDQVLTGVISAGTDKTNSVNLSTDLGFLTGADYLLDGTDFCNTALIAGEGEGADRTKSYIIPSSATQRNRRELYVDARDLQKTSDSTEEPMSDEEYLAALTQRGQKKLLDFPLYESYECSLQLAGESGYVFGEDYNLGDTITLTDSTLMIQVQALVKEHQMSEDKDGRIDTLVFGVCVPTITYLVKRRD